MKSAELNITKRISEIQSPITAKQERTICNCLNGVLFQI